METRVIALVRNYKRRTADALFVQFASGLLLSFYYVPSVDHCTSVAFIEKAASSGSGFVLFIITAHSGYLSSFSSCVSPCLA